MDEQSRPASGIEALRELERFLEGAAQARAGLSELERGSERRARELARLELQAHIDARGGDVGKAIIIGGVEGSVRLAYRRTRSRQILSVFGRVTVRRTGYGAPGERTVYPLDSELELPARTYSYECQRRLIRAVVCSPFDEAISLVAEMIGTVVPKRAAEQIVLEAAADFEEFYTQRASEAVKPARGEIVVGAIDCKGIPMVKPEHALRVVRRGKGQKANKKRMATVATVYSQAPQVRTPQEVLDNLFATNAAAAARKPRQPPTHKRVWASLQADKDTFIADVHGEMRRRDPRRRRTWVIVTDGERALQRRVTKSFNGVTLVLDFLHALEKLWLCAHALHREGSPEAQAFVYQRAERILEGNVSQVIKGLRLIVTKRNLTGTKAKTLRNVAAYYQSNRQRMRYDTYLANGWPIASGSVEGACKNLIRDRFERSGMRWTLETAESLLRLRAIYLSSDLNSYWAFHIRQDQQRQYPSWQVDSK